MGNNINESNISKDNTYLSSASQRDLSITEEHNTKENWRRLNLEVSRSQSNLKLITQRILYCLDNNIKEFLAGALQDLFISLQDKGWALRHRMYNLCSPLLEYTERTYFQKWLADSSDTELENFHFVGSVFMGQSNSKKSDLNNAHDSIQHHAQHLIEQGKLASAQVLLEETCLKNHKLKLENKELQDFYFHSRNKGALSDFISKLRDARKKPMRSWLKIQKESELW